MNLRELTERTEPAIKLAVMYRHLYRSRQGKWKQVANDAFPERIRLIKMTHNRTK